MENKNNKLVYGVIIGLLIVVCCILVICVTKPNNNEEKQNNTKEIQQNDQQEVQQNKQEEKINYEIVENNGSYMLTVNGKNTNVDLMSKESDQIAQLSDTLVATVCTARCNVYVVDKDANIIATTDSSINAETLKVKGSYITNSKIVNNELYITSENIMLNTDVETICDTLQSSKNSDVKFEEKFTYNNGKFEQATTIKSVSADEFAKENNLNCKN